MSERAETIANELVDVIKRYVQAEIYAHQDTEPDSLGAYYEEQNLREVLINTLSEVLPQNG